MEVSDLREIVSGLEKQLKDKKHDIDDFFGGITAVSELIWSLNGITNLLDRVMEEQRQWAGVGVALMKTWGEGVEQKLQILKLVFDEVKELLEFSNYSELTDYSVKNVRIKAKGVLMGLSALANKSLYNVIQKEELIGRDQDMEAIKQMILQESGRVSVIPIVGMPGIGKTFLTQHLYHEFMATLGCTLEKNKPQWVCMSQIKQPADILNHVVGFEYASTTKILLVLDGIEQVHEGVGGFLKELFDEVGSDIVVLVTSSCHPTEVVRIMAPLPVVQLPYELGILSEDESWTLFKSLSFKEEEDELSDIGQEICERCAGVPRVIKTVAAILSLKQTSEEWKDFHGLMLANEEAVKILSVASFSQLLLSLEKYLTYCSLFPNYHNFTKKDLIHLLMAQGFLKDRSEELHLAGDEYLRELHKDAHFLEDGDRDSSGGTHMMCDVAYELVKHVRRHELLPAEFIRHLIFVIDSSWQALAWQPAENLLRDGTASCNLQSLLILPSESHESIVIPDINGILSNLESLQALDLAGVNCENIVISSKKLKNLRYLRLGTCLESLPKCIIELQNLETLDLRHSRVRALPEEFSKCMINLKHLYTGETLNDMPPYFGKLASLQTLDVFVLGQNNGLHALSLLNRLAGNLKIRFENGYENYIMEETTAIFRDRNLTGLFFTWPAAHVHEDVDDWLLRCLQPPTTLESLVIQGWRGVTLQQWVIDDLSILLPNLTYICIGNCRSCQHLPTLSTLPQLESLNLWHLNALEYVENGDATTIYFPSLKYLRLLNLPELKGWSRSVDHQRMPQSIFPCLLEVRVSGCPKLESMPLMPSLESLEADDIHEKLLMEDFKIIRALKLINMPKLESFPEILGCLTTLEQLSLCWLYNMRCLPECIGNLSQLRQLAICYCPILTTLPSSLGFLPTLRHLELRCCPRLREVPKSFPNLRSLEKLVIQECPKLVKRCCPDGEDWLLIQHISQVQLG